MTKNIFYLLLLNTFISLFKVEALTEQEERMQKEIKHVVILMLENRSFDNMLAWLYENDVPSQFIPATNNQPYKGLSCDTLDQYTNFLRNSKNETVYSCAPIRGIPSVNGTPYLNSPQCDPHEPFPHVQLQMYGLDGGKDPTMTGFLQDFASFWRESEWLDQKDYICAIMETYTPKELPILNGLAKHYAVSDEWFSSVPTQTNPNRAFFFCGTSEGETVNGFLGKNDFQSDTIWNRLYQESPNTSWGVFWQGDMTPLLFPGPYSGINNFAAFEKIPDHQNHFMKFDSFHELARKGELPAISFLEPLWTISENFSYVEDNLLDIIKDSQLIIGLGGNDLHPPGDVRLGENLVANVYTSLISNPKAWEETLLIITFDEHGGLFDHVPPPVAVAPDAFNQKGFNFDRYGVRVPTLFISPKVGKSVVVRSDNEDVPYDHTSFIAALMKWCNIDPSKWNFGNRTAIAPTFEGVITQDPPRNDYYLVDDNTILPVIHEDNVVHAGDEFYLKDKNGLYFSNAGLFGKYAKTAMKIAGEKCKIRHGSSCILQLGDKVLSTGRDGAHCSFVTYCHCPNQWWTIKSFDHPIVGLEIQYGDRVFLENHYYLDFTKIIPARLSQKASYFSRGLRTTSVLDPDCDECYWIIEKATDK